MTDRGSEVSVGVVGRPWGIKGQFVVDPRGADPALLLSGGRLRLRREGKAGVELAILGSHFAGGRLVVAVEGCGSPDEAAALRGSEVFVDRSDFQPAPAGSYYPHELAGLEVVKAGGGGPVGRVERVIESGGADLLLVRAGEREMLIPFAEDICRVDLDSGRIEIDPPAGLLDLD